MKLQCPELFKCPLPSENLTVLELQAHYLLPNRDTLGRRIFIIRLGLYIYKCFAFFFQLQLKYNRFFRFDQSYN